METLFEITETIRCTSCNSTNIKRNGTIGLEQRYYCKNCHKTFTRSFILPTTPANTNPNSDKSFCSLSQKLLICSKYKDLETDDDIIMGCIRCPLYEKCLEWWDTRVCDLASTHILDQQELEILDQEFIELVGVWG